MENNQKKMIRCPYCGAEFEELLPRCPYCDRTSYKGAEAEYLNKLEDVREDMQDLEKVPGQEIKKELHSRWHYIRKKIVVILLILLVLAMLPLAVRFCDGQDSRKQQQSELAWMEEYGGELDGYYEQGEYQKLFDRYVELVQEDKRPPYSWKHDRFMRICMDSFECMELIRQADEGEKLSDYEYAEILTYEWQVYDEDYSAGNVMTKKERAWYLEYSQPLLEDFEIRWQFTEEEIQELKDSRHTKYSGLSYEKTMEIVRNRLGKEE